MIRMSMNELSTYSWTFEEDVLRYAAAGFDAIGVWRPKVSDFGELRAVELLQESGLSVSNLLWAGGFTGSDGRGFSESVEDAKEAILLARDLQTDCLVVYSGSRSGHTRNHARRLTRQALSELLPVAAECGVTLALEPVHADIGGEWTFLNELEDTLEFLRSVPSPHLKIAFDAYHLGLAKLDLRRIEAIAPQVAIVHLADGRHPPHGEPNRCLLGEGTIPLAEIANALMDGGYTGYFDVELMGEDIEFIQYADILDHSRQALQRMLGEYRTSAKS